MPAGSRDESSAGFLKIAVIFLAPFSFKMSTAPGRLLFPLPAITTLSPDDIFKFLSVLLLKRSIKRNVPGKTLAVLSISWRSSLESQPPVAVNTALKPSFKSVSMVKSLPAVVLVLISTPICLTPSISHSRTSMDNLSLEIAWRRIPPRESVVSKTVGSCPSLALKNAVDNP